MPFTITVNMRYAQILWTNRKLRFELKCKAFKIKINDQNFPNLKLIKKLKLSNALVSISLPKGYFKITPFVKR